MDTPAATGSDWNPLISYDSVTNDLIQVYEAEINKQQVNMRKKSYWFIGEQNQTAA